MSSLLRTMLALTLLLSFSFGASAQTRVENKVTTATLLSEHSTTQAGSEIWFAIELETQAGWHTYWQNAGDSGMASTLQWQLPDGMTASPIHWLPPHRIEFSGLYNYGYEEKTALLSSVHIPEQTAAGDYDVTVKANWLVCKDICIPESATLSTRITIGDSKITADQQAIRDYIKQLPSTPELKSGYQIAGDRVSLSFDLALIDDVASAWWFPIDDGIITNDSEQQLEKDGKTLWLHAARGNREAKPHFAGLLALTMQDGTTQYLDIAAPLTADEAATPTITPLTAEPAATTPDSTPASRITFWGALLSAFLGGLILNLMPCVLPVLSLKALSIAKQSDSQPQAVKWQGIAYTLGVLATFTIFATLLITLKAAGETVGWGFQLQSPVFVATLAYLLFLVGLSLSGLFYLPALFGNVASIDDTRHPLTNAFGTGILATLLATPCTAPFMAAALGFAVTQPSLLLLAIFLSLGFGLAFPYLAICFVPALRRLLPKPGAWMLRFKELMAFPIYASVVWLLWVLVQQTGADGLAVALLGLVLLAFAVWLLPLLGRVARIIALLVILALGGWSLCEQSNIQQPTLTLSSGSEIFSPTLLAEYRSANRPVFVYATAAWCITCKVNERVALQSDSVAQHFDSNDIAILKADWTNFDQSITDYLASFERNGVPIYVYYPPDGEPKILPQLLTPQLVIDETS